MRVKTIAKVVGVTVAAAVVAVVALLMSVDVGQYRDVIARQAEAATGRALTIAGPIDLSLSLEPAVVLEDVAFANASWGSRPEMMTAERIEAQVEIIPLLTGDIRVKRLVVVRPDVLLEVNAEGVGNWALGGGGTAEASSDAPPAGAESAPVLPDLALVQVRDATITFRDQGAGTDRTLTLTHLEAAAAGLAQPLSVQAAGAADGIPFDLSGRLGPLRDLLSTAVAYPVVLKGTVAGADVALDGHVEDVAAMTGVDMGVAVSVPEPAAVADATGVALPAGLPALRLDGRVTGGGSDWSVGNLAASAGESSMAGSLSVSFAGPRPAVQGVLSSPFVDLAALLPKGSGQGAAAAAGPGEAAPAGAPRLIPDAPLPVEALRIADASVEFTVTRLLLPEDLEMRDVAGKVSLSGGRLAVAPLSLAVAGGTLRTKATIDGSADGAAVPVALEVIAEGIQLGEVLETLGHGGVLQDGPVDVTADLTGRGNSLHPLMDSLDGTFRMTVGQGTIDNTAVRSWVQDVALRMIDSLNPFAAKEQYTVLQCAVVKMDVADGIARTDRGIALETPRFHVSGSGAVDLGSETLDMAIQTAVREGTGAATAGLANLIRVQGSLAAPQMGIDVGGAAKTVLSAGAALLGGAGLSDAADRLTQGQSADPHPCATALGTAPPPAQAPAEQPAAEAPGPVPALPNDPLGAVQGLGENLGEGLKGLFGR